MVGWRTPPTAGRVFHCQPRSGWSTIGSAQRPYYRSVFHEQSRMPLSWWCCTVHQSFANEKRSYNVGGAWTELVTQWLWHWALNAGSRLTLTISQWVAQLCETRTRNIAGRLSETFSDKRVNIGLYVSVSISCLSLIAITAVDYSWNEYHVNYYYYYYYYITTCFRLTAVLLFQVHKDNLSR